MVHIWQYPHRAKGHRNYFVSGFYVLWNAASVRGIFAESTTSVRIYISLDVCSVEWGAFYCVDVCRIQQHPSVVSANILFLGDIDSWELVIRACNLLPYLTFSDSISGYLNTWASCTGKMGLHGRLCGRFRKPWVQIQTSLDTHSSTSHSHTADC